MAVVEHDGLMTYIDENGNTNLLFPVTKAGNVDGLEEMLNSLRDHITETMNGISKVQRKSGSFTTDKNGAATVNCGFQPDIVYIKGPDYEEDGNHFPMSASVAFEIETRAGYPNIQMLNPDAGSKMLYDLTFERTAAGFAADFWSYNGDWHYEAVKNTTFEYTAVKYT